MGNKELLQQEFDNLDNEDFNVISDTQLYENQLHELELEEAEFKRCIRKFLKKEDALLSRIDSLRDQLIDERVKIDELREPKTWLGRVISVVKPSDDGLDESYLDKLTFSEFNADVTPSSSKESGNTMPELKPESDSINVDIPIKPPSGDTIEFSPSLKDNPSPASLFFAKAIDILFSSPGECEPEDVDNGMLNYDYPTPINNKKSVPYRNYHNKGQNSLNSSRSGRSAGADISPRIFIEGEKVQDNGGWGKSEDPLEWMKKNSHHLNSNNNDSETVSSIAGETKPAGTVGRRRAALLQQQGSDRGFVRGESLDKKY